MTAYSGRGPLLNIGLLHQYRLATSGSGLYLARVAGHLLSRGHRLTVMTHDRFAAEALSFRPIASQRRCTFYSLRSAGTPVAYPRAEEPGSQLFRDLSDAELYEYLDRHVSMVQNAVMEAGVDVMHVNSETPMSWVASVVASRTGIPYVTVGHGSTLEYLVSVDARFRSLCRIGLAQSASVVALNKDVSRRMLAVVPEIAGRVVQVPGGVDCVVFRPLRTTGAPPPTLLYVGRISLEKGVFHLLGSLGELGRRIPDLRVVVVGDGVSRPLLESMYAALRAGDLGAAGEAVVAASEPSQAGWVTALKSFWRCSRSFRGSWPEVEFTGHLPAALVAGRLATADLLVVPSLVREAFPLVVLEALACGTPVMAVDKGGLGAVLDELTPALGPLGEHMRLPARVEELLPALSPAVERLLRWLDGGHRDAARRACRELAETRYAWPRIVDDLERLYYRALSDDGRQHDASALAGAAFDQKHRVAT